MKSLPLAPSRPHRLVQVVLRPVLTIARDADVTVAAVPQTRWQQLLAERPELARPLTKVAANLRWTLDECTAARERFEALERHVSPIECVEAITSLADCRRYQWYGSTRARRFDRYWRAVGTLAREHGEWTLAARGGIHLSTTPEVIALKLVVPAALLAPVAARVQLQLPRIKSGADLRGTIRIGRRERPYGSHSLRDLLAELDPTRDDARVVCLILTAAPATVADVRLRLLPINHPACTGAVP